LQKVTTLPKQALSRPSVSEWKVGSLRLTAFPSASADFSDPTWWEDVLGAEPEQHTIQPKTKEHIYLGDYGKGILTLNVHPVRIEWQLGTPELAESVLTEVPTIGLLEDVVGSFESLMKKWLASPTCPSLNRIAFGALFLYPVANRAAGYRLISLYLPFKVSASGASDFLYQINRRRSSKTGIKGLEINRLQRWLVMQFDHTLRVNLAFSKARSTTLYANALELDINTTPDFNGELQRERLVDVLSELIALGKEIAEKGDIP
jgi:hypothetical protein